MTYNQLRTVNIINVWYTCSTKHTLNDGIIIENFISYVIQSVDLLPSHHIKKSTTVVSNSLHTQLTSVAMLPIADQHEELIGEHLNF